MKTRTTRVGVAAVLALVALALPVVPTAATVSTEPELLLVGRWAPWTLPYPDEGDADLWIAEYDGTLLVRLTNTPHRDEAPGSWAPDGHAIVFESGPWYGRCNVQIIKPDGTGKRTFAGGPSNDYAPKWSPDGRWISWIHTPADSSFASLRIAHPNGTDMREIEIESRRISSHVWSPDGSRIAFSSYLADEGDSEIFTMAPDGSDLERLTFDRTGDQVLDWTPNGQKILYSRAGRVDRLSTIRPDGTHLRTLEYATVYGARVAPSGGPIAYEAFEGGRHGFTALWNRTHDGTETKVLSFDGYSHLDTTQCS